MTWDPNSIYGCEAAKIAPLVVQYLQGRCLDIGSGPGKVWPQVIGIDIGHDQGNPVTDMLMDGADLGTFADSSIDGIFSSHMLDKIEKSKVPAVLREWTRVLKVGGYLVLYLPAAGLIPDGEGHPDTKWKAASGDIEDMLRDHTGDDWTLIEREERDDGDEASLWIVIQKQGDGWEERLWQRNPDGRKRALVIRYGAIGDAFVAASVFPLLKAQGYHITVNAHPKTHDVLRHDPNVDEWLIQETDFVPNHALGPYWEGISKRYDRVVNLSESVEGLLLTLPGRLNHGYSYEARRAIYDNINYLEHTHNIAAVPHNFSGARFHPTEAEQQWAMSTRARKDGPVVVWCVHGSSYHKLYPWVDVVAAWLLTRTPAHIVLYGDPDGGQKISQAILNTMANDRCDMGRVVSIADKWSIRQSLTFARYADVIVGPETGPMNAMGMEDVPKVIYLSHSTEANLTKHWANTTTLLPDQERCPCFPCHRLHMNMDFCHLHKPTKTALCAASVSAERVFEAIALALGATKQAEAAD